MLKMQLNCVEQEQLAAQIVALMDAHFRRPTVEEKNKILRLVADQITAAVLLPKAIAQES